MEITQPFSGAVPVQPFPGVVTEVRTPGSFTLAIPAGATFYEFILQGAGGAGGAGRRGAVSTVRIGGNGGGCGAHDRVRGRVADLPASTTVNVGAGGVGGAAQTVDSTDGASGTNGGDTTVGAPGDAWYARAEGGGGGKGGGAVQGANTVPTLSLARTCIGGATALSTGVGVQGFKGWGPGGSAGGGITSGNVVGAGADGWDRYGVTSAATHAPAPAGQVLRGSRPASGASGAASNTAAAGAGKPGADGGPGGGGGASLDGFNSGAGGAGGDGYFVAIFT